MEQNNQADIDVKVCVEAYNRCKDALDSFYKRNIQIIQQAHTPIMLQLPNEGLGKYEKHGKMFLYFLVLNNSNTNQYSIYVKIKSDSPSLELLNNIIYNVEFTEHKNILLAYCETILKDGVISIDSEGKYILR